MVMKKAYFSNPQIGKADFSTKAQTCEENLADPRFHDDELHEDRFGLRIWNPRNHNTHSGDSHGVTTRLPNNV